MIVHYSTKEVADLGSGPKFLMISSAVGALVLISVG